MTPAETLLFRVNGMPQGKTRLTQRQVADITKLVEKERERGE